MLKKAGVVALLLFVALLIAPAASPVQISYVVSDSMSPTIGTNDGYILVDTGAVEEGDIITYYSEERGTAVTHRAVEVSEDGIVTQGDANPSTDQAAGYPLVQPADVSGTVLTLGGGPLRIPNLGVGVALLRSYWYVTGLLLAGGVLYSLAGSARQRQRAAVLRSREVVLTATAVAVIVSASLVALAATHQTTVYQVTENETPGDRTLTVGAERTESMTVRLSKTSATYALTETEGMTLTNATVVDEPGDSPGGAGALGWLRSRFLQSERQNLTATIPAQTETGPHRTSLSVYTYPRTLPRGVVVALHDVHPLLAALSTVLVGVGPLYAVYWLLVDTVVPLRGTRSRRLRRLGGDR